MNTLRFSIFVLSAALLFSCNNPVIPVQPSTGNTAENKPGSKEPKETPQPQGKEDTVPDTVNPIKPKDVTQGIPHLVIVSAPLFTESAALKTYREHKIKQGHEVTLIAAKGKSAEAIRQELKTFYKTLNGKMMAVLLVGDHVSSHTSGTAGYVPAFESTVYKKPHPTDYYYGEYDGEYGSYDGKTGEYNDAWLQEAPVGRFCVSTLKELQACIDKTMYMEEKIREGEPPVTRVIRTSDNVNGVQTGTIGNYLSSYPELTVEPVSIYSPNQVSARINEGAGFVVYTGHGLPDSWLGKFTTAHAGNLTNKVYPIVIASTCLSGSYQYYSLGEAFMNNGSGGAVAYIGASAESYADYNIVMTCGNKDSFNTEKPGIVDSLYYSADTDKAYRSRTIGKALQAGHRAMYRFGHGSASNSVGDKTKYSVEIYNLLGDPTYMPYTQKPKALTFTFENDKGIMKGRNFVVQTAPQAQIAVTRKTAEGIKIIAAGYANEDGKAVLPIPDTVEAGDADLYAIAPNYIGHSQKIKIRENSGIKGSIAALKRITVGNKSIDVTEDKSAYSVSVAYEENPVKVSAETHDPAARVTGEGTYHLNAGLNTLKITVTAEDGVTVNRYTLTIERKETTKSKDASLKSVRVTVNGEEKVLEPSAESSYLYDIQIAPDVKRIHVKAVPTSSTASCKIEGDDVDIPIVEGYPYYYPISVYVTPEFSEAGTKTYTIRVYKTDAR
ncbi:cadherin-like beta sandwich domain-containing protein [Treponema sp. OMZ 787]|uniref:C25 family cysteine peptidase n=1 Tax=Treponema sp. OMZ 787 TaxID=2563669 RepID=UPI0020A3EE0C|nr:C25 family cysteine peptidase [Treponema sp. OMZ 787]UTC62036.1 cadherin-like beta sandwich domain-containing protein [Treponema sp. OMZ 787]